MCASGAIDETIRATLVACQASTPSSVSASPPQVFGQIRSMWVRALDTAVSTIATVTPAPVAPVSCIWASPRVHDASTVSDTVSVGSDTDPLSRHDNAQAIAQQSVWGRGTPERYACVQAT